jgi:hypothetical protein
MHIDGVAGTYCDQYLDGFIPSTLFSINVTNTLTDLPLVKLDMSLDFSIPIAHIHNCPISGCTECNGLYARKSKKPLWILDLGASKHFTFTLSNFLEYIALKYPIKVTIAANPIFIIGEGTVLLQHYVNVKELLVLLPLPCQKLNTTQTSLPPPSKSLGSSAL